MLQCVLDDDVLFFLGAITFSCMLQCVLDDDVLFFLRAITFSCMLQYVLDDDVLFLDDRALFFYHVWLYSSVVDDGFGNYSRTQISGESLLNDNDVLLSPLPPEFISKSSTRSSVFDVIIF
jgi:hypothetical protein